MASYNEIDGVPSHINHWLLDKVLRQEWGIPGLRISPTATACRCWWKRITWRYNNADAARQGLAAGIDYDLSDGSVYRTLVDQVKRALFPRAKWTMRCAQVLAAKFRLGLFDNPYVDPDYAERITNSPEHRKLAIEAARKSHRPAEERQESASARLRPN